MSRLIFTIFLLILFSCSAAPKLVRFSGYRVYRLHPKNIDQLKILSELEVKNKELVFFDPTSSVLRPIHVLVAPNYFPPFLKVLSLNHIRQELVEADFQNVLDLEQAELQRRSSAYDWTGYHTLNETYEWLQSLAERYPQQVQLLVGGESYEGRQILGVKVSFKAGNKGIFLEAGIHACEWISPATVTYLLNEILTNKDTKARSIVEKFDWYVFPHFNPDGYEYTHTTNRLWRKTRSKGVKCDGADPNRNWGFRWMEAGASLDECSNNFGGKVAFSETETKTISEFLSTLKDKIHTYVAFHSYGQVLVHPYAAIPQHVPNYEDLKRIGEVTVGNLSKLYGTQYKVGSVYDIIYPAAGSSPDWVYGVLNVPIVFTYELRPYSSPNGFILPSSQILPTGRETFDSLLGMIVEADKLGYYT